MPESTVRTLTSQPVAERLSTAREVREIARSHQHAADARASAAWRERRTLIDTGPIDLNLGLEFYLTGRIDKHRPDPAAFLRHPAAPLARLATARRPFRLVGDERRIGF